MEMHVLDSCIQGHHVSKDFWMPLINEELVCAQESGNPHDPYAVAIKKGSIILMASLVHSFAASGFISCSLPYVLIHLLKLGL